MHVCNPSSPMTRQLGESSEAYWLVSLAHTTVNNKRPCLKQGRSQELTSCIRACTHKYTHEHSHTQLITKSLAPMPPFITSLLLGWNGR